MKQVLLITLLSFSVLSFSQTPGNALSFDGTNDHVSCGLPTVFTDISNNDFTIEFWVYPTSGGTQRAVFAQQDGTNFSSVLLNSTNTVYYYVYYGGTYGSIKSNAGLPTNTWSHVACTWEANSQTLLMYVDGVLQPIVGGGSSSSGATNNSMYLGSTTVGDQNLIGDLDEVRIWDYARSECEINASMNSEFDLAQTGLVAYYKMNEGTAGGNNAGVVTVPDFTTNYNGTATNFALTGASSNWIASTANITELNQNSGGVFNPISDAICSGLTYSFGSQNLDTAGVYYDTLTTVNGCDSIVELTLDVTEIDTNVNVATWTVEAVQSGGTYQWLDCGDAYAPVTGATNQMFSPTVSGTYACMVTYNGCVDTTVCQSVAAGGIGFAENPLENFVNVYPNPTDGVINIAIDQNIEDPTIIVKTLDGKIVHQLKPISGGTFSIELEGASGLYFVEIISNGQKAVYKVSKE